MRTHTSEFKDAIKTFGRELDSIITYEEDSETIVLGNEDLNSVSLRYEGTILKSIMKQLDIDSNVEIPVGTEINYQFGIKVRYADAEDYRDNYDYIDYGNYIVYKVEKQEDMSSYKITCYDKMLYSMKDYVDMNIIYPITVRDYIGEICNYLGLTFANTTDTFVNYNKQIPNELFIGDDGKNLGYTFRDILDQLAQVTASTICINKDDELEIRYITDTEDTIDEEYLKDVNVTFGESFGPINTIVLSRGAGADNVYYPAVLPENPKELKITDNVIMSGNDRDIYLAGIYNKLNGLTFMLNDFSSTGICYYDICDRYNVSIGKNTYSCVMLNDEVNITQGLEENIYTELPEETVTDYTKADTTDRRINQTNLIVDKQQGIIEGLVSNTTYISDTKTGTGSITLENANEGQLYKLSIKGNISLLFPQSDELYGYALTPHDGLEPSNTLVPSSPVPYNNDVLYPSSTLYSKETNLIIDDTTYKLDFDFLNYMSTTVYDEFIYENGTCYIIRRVGIDSEGNMYQLATEVIEPRRGIILNVKANSTITLQSFPTAILSCTYLLENIFTDSFATEAYVQSNISQTAESITEEVNAKVGDDEIIAKLNLAIQDGQGIINLTGNQITIDSDNFTLDADGKITATAGDIAGFSIESSNGFVKEIYAPYDYTESDYTRLQGILLGTITPTQQDYEKYDFNDDGQFSSADLINLRWYLISGITTTNSGKFVITAPPSSKKLFDAKMGYFDGNNNFINGFGHSGGVFYSIDVQSASTSNVINITPDYLTISDGLNNVINMQASNGNITCVSLTQTSKEEEKKNFAKLTNALDIIKNTDIYKYNLKNENDEDKKHIGFVIGDNYKYSEEITSPKNDGVDIYSMVSVCLQAIKEQQKIIENLQERIEKLERESDKEWL